MRKQQAKPGDNRKQQAEAKPSSGGQQQGHADPKDKRQHEQQRTSTARATTRHRGNTTMRRAIRRVRQGRRRGPRRRSRARTPMHCRWPPPKRRAASREGRRPGAEPQDAPAVAGNRRARRSPARRSRRWLRTHPIARPGFAIDPAARSELPAVGGRLGGAGIHPDEPRPDRTGSTTSPTATDDFHLAAAFDD